MKFRTLLATAALTFAAQAAATPAMSVITINAEDPVGYMKWAEKSGPAIGKAVGAMSGGVCMATAGYGAPGELYYWHTFKDHASAMVADIYHDTVAKEVAKLKIKRTLSRADTLSLVMNEELIIEEGDTFTNWNLTIKTDQPELYVQQLTRINDAATERGFGDATLSAYAYLTGEQAGNLLVVVQAPSSERLGDILDQLDSDWMSPMMSGLSGIRSYVGGVTTDCKVVYMAN